jgi:hypothetical protein
MQFSHKPRKQTNPDPERRGISVISQVVRVVVQIVHKKATVKKVRKGKRERL